MSALTTVTVPKDYGYVILSVTASYFVSFWHGARIGRFRKAVGPSAAYPKPYAVAAPGKDLTREEYLFNCAQRAHGNFLENYGIALPAMLIAGLNYPVTAAALGLGWSVNRVIYAVGYTRGDKDKGQGRMLGAGFWLCQLALMVLSGKVGYDLL